MRYLDCPEGSLPWKIRQLLEDNSTAIDPAVVQIWHDLIGKSSPAEAAGVAGRQKWGLVLSSSAQVSQVTYQTGLECAILSWSHSMGQVGSLVSLSAMKNRREGASSLSFGISYVLTRMKLRTLELLLNG